MPCIAPLIGALRNLFYRSITSHAVYRMRLADAPDAPCRIGERFQGAAEIFNRCVPAGRNECVVIEPGLTKAAWYGFCPKSSHGESGNESWHHLSVSPIGDWSVTNRPTNLLTVVMLDPIYETTHSLF